MLVCVHEPFCRKLCGGRRHAQAPIVPSPPLRESNGKVRWCRLNLPNSIPAVFRNGDLRNSGRAGAAKGSVGGEEFVFRFGFEDSFLRAASTEGGRGRAKVSLCRSL